MFGCVPFCTWIVREKWGNSYINLHNFCYFFGTHIYIYCGGEVTTTRSQWQKGNLSFLGFVKGKT